MSQKLKNSVLTLVALNRKQYEYCDFFVRNLLRDYNISSIRSKKLSLFVKDYHFQCNNKNFIIIKNTIKVLSHKADIIIQKLENRRKKIIACDMDMTIINVETINLINDHLLNNNKIKHITEKAMNGSINFTDSLLSRTKMLKGIKEKKIKNLIRKIKINSGVKSVIRTMNFFGFHTILISGGYDAIANVIGNKVGFKEIRSNSLEIKNQTLTGNLNDKIIDKKGKLKYLKKSMSLLKVPKELTMSVGDGDNDLAMIEFAGLGVAWRAYPKVRKAADVSIGLNFKSLLYFQGYSDNEITFKLTKF